MPNCLIVYFSQAGSTAKVSSAIAEGLRNEGYDVDTLSLTEGKSLPVLDYDLLGFGSPVFNYGLPLNVVDFLRSLPRLNRKPTFLFNTNGTYQFDAGARFVKLARAKGASVVGYFACRGWDSFLGYAKVGWLFSASHPDAGDLSNATAFAREVVKRTAGQKQTIAGNLHTVPAPTVYRLERFFTNRCFTSQFYSRFFRVDNSLCNSCGLCSKKCPTSNIERDGRGRPIWHRHCIGCLMCEMNCPRAAITSPLADWAVFRPFLRYNVQKACADKSLEGARARHIKGKIELL